MKKLVMVAVVLALMCSSSGCSTSTIGRANVDKAKTGEAKVGEGKRAIGSRGKRFSVSRLKAGAYPTVPGATSGRQLSSALQPAKTALHQAVRRLSGGRLAIVDDSLVSDDIATATTAGSVELSWKPESPAYTYAVLRDERRLGLVRGSSGYFRDDSVEPGRSYAYRVTPVSSPQAERSWGTAVHVPSPAAAASSGDALERSVSQDVRASLANPTTTLTWVAFIRQARVRGPWVPHACRYGARYNYGGDNHGFDWRSSRYRSVINALINWDTRTVSAYPSVRPTHVYRRSTGKLVAVKTASTKALKAKAVGGGDGYVYIAMVHHAKNPFCPAGAISGSINIKISRSGTWEIRSGSAHRMPDHYIFIYHAGHVTGVWKARALSMWCLAGDWRCDASYLTGYLGSYAWRTPGRQRG